MHCITLYSSYSYIRLYDCVQDRHNPSEMVQPFLILSPRLRIRMVQPFLDCLVVRRIKTPNIDWNYRCLPTSKNYHLEDQNPRENTDNEGLLQTLSHVGLFLRTRKLCSFVIKKLDRSFFSFAIPTLYSMSLVFFNVKITAMECRSSQISYLRDFRWYFILRHSQDSKR